MSETFVVDPTGVIMETRLEPSVAYVDIPVHLLTLAFLQERFGPAGHLLKPLLSKSEFESFPANSYWHMPRTCFGTRLLAPSFAKLRFEGCLQGISLDYGKPSFVICHSVAQEWMVNLTKFAETCGADSVSLSFDVLPGMWYEYSHGQRTYYMEETTQDYFFQDEAARWGWMVRHFAVTGQPWWQNILDGRWFVPLRRGEDRAA